ncbi:MAG: AMP-binding protein [Gemmatimonadaceae bacterium]
MSDNPNIAARLAERAWLHPERLALLDGRSKVGFSQLAEEVDAIGGALERGGVRAGDNVLVFVPMSVHLYTTLLGCLHAGAVAVFVDAWSDRRRLDAAVHAARPRAFVGSARAQLLRLASGPIRRIPRHFIAGTRALKGGPSSAAIVDGDSAALVTFTTGSTGTPKAAVRSHAFLWAQHEVLAAHLGLRESDVDMPTLPIFVLNNLALGVPSILPAFDPRRPGDINPRRIYAQIVREGVTTSSGSPAFYERLADWCLHRRLTLPLRSIFTGGAPVLPPLARRLRDAVQGTVHVLYGSTEAEPISGITSDEMVALSEIPGSEGVCAGFPVPEIELRLVRPHDELMELGPAGWPEWDVAAGETGEVVVTGRHVLRGYLGDPGAERRNKIADGARVWHRTGDAARFDAEGRLWLMGRVRERVRRDGKVWWPLPAEVRARSVAGISHAAYLGLPDQLLEQRAVLCVEADPREIPRLRTALRRALDGWPLDELRVLRRIPRDPRHASKTNADALRALLAG